MQTAEPQAILAPITQAAIFLTLTVDPGAEDQVRDALSDVSGLKRSVGFRIPEAQLSCVTGWGPRSGIRCSVGLLPPGCTRFAS